MFRHPKLVQRLAALLAERKAAPTTFALDAGLSRTAVIHILDGTIKSPKLETLEALARKLEVTVAYLIGETDLREEADTFVTLLSQMHPDDRERLKDMAKRLSERAA